MTSKCSLRVVFSDFFWSKEKIISSNYRTNPTTKTQCILCNTILAIELYFCKNKSCIELERWPRHALARYSIHCWKYFSPRSNFGTKNPKLGSDNPFVLSVNFKNHLDLVCQFLDWQWSKLLDKGSNIRIPNSKYITMVALIQ